MLPLLAPAQGTSRRLAWIALSARGMAPATLAKGLAAEGGDPVRLLQAGSHPRLPLSSPGGDGWKLAAGSILMSCQKQGIEIITPEDGDWPESLRQLPDPPAALYVRGPLALLHRPKRVALVGSRRAGAVDLNGVRRLAEGLSRQGVTVVSGLAMGVDAAAHAGALGGSGGTIAVLASGVEAPTPRYNERLAQRMLDSGSLLCSEHPPGTRPQKIYFPWRNRLIAALSRGVVMAAVGEQSGALITARLALDLGREVMVVPGPPDAAHAGGHRLIRQGATLVTQVGEILEQQGWPLEDDPLAQPALPMASDPQILKVISILESGPAGMDRLALGSGLTLPELSTILAHLSLSGHIDLLPGDRYGLAAGPV